MPITLNDVIVTTENPRAPTIVLYGVEKIGKSSFAAQADNPIFIRTEDGISNVKAKAFPVCRSWEDVMDCMTELAQQPHDYRTVVVDSLDWLEPIIWKQVCKDYKVDNIEKVDGGYGKGYIAALDYWRLYLECLDYLRDVRGMTVIQIAHSKVKEIKAPDAEIYDKYTLKLQEGKNTSASAVIFEHADMVLFANYHINIVKEQINNDKNKTRSRAIGTDTRYLFTEERPAFKAGNRYNLPDKIAFTRDGAAWQVLKNNIPFYNTPTQGE